MERIFEKDGQRRAAITPAAAVSLIHAGWREVKTEAAPDVAPEHDTEQGREI